MKHLKVLTGLTLALAALPATSFAQLAYAAKQVNLRAGPATDYPIVAILMAGVPVTVQGCLSDYRWCDVVAGANRGWVYAANIVYPYQGANVPVLNYGALIGLGIVAFSVASYWDSYYVGRPWYPQRPLWVNRPMPGFGAGGHRQVPPGHRPPGAGQPPAPHGREPGGNKPAPPHAREPEGNKPLPRHAQEPGSGQRPPQHDAGPAAGHRPTREQGPGVR